MRDLTAEPLFKIALILAFLLPLANGVDNISVCDTHCYRQNLSCENFCEEAKRIILNESTYLCERWDTIKHNGCQKKYNDTMYLALVDNYEWLTTHHNYNWSDDANNCYIDYRNMRLGWTEGTVIGKGIRPLVGANLFFSIFLIILLIVSIILSYIFSDLCRTQKIIIFGFILSLIALLLAISSFDGNKSLDFFTFIASGYGRRPLYTMFLSISVILLFASHIYLYPRIPDSSPDESKKHEQKQENCIDPHLIDLNRAWRSFWLSAAIFLSADINDTDKKIYDKMGPLAVIETALGWILLAIFIATLSNVVIIRSGLS